ncbi:ATP-binding cassette domain-containing protein [Paenibacillus hexagrammi]|uniref:ATP-binding cassette domain-containing protein n=1 Tax=Paenibacillus hexagrammi TaxID=2908839 RepID=A0ABY3SJ19_9BACL|nr:ATP-binding cassette domain-containing protein [Paenibacillus sp. YPD9-1]UJF34034.1 ATP-binding cassette domain-containing protein [Paenibacillus sp. YPD9-1]
MSDRAAIALHKASVAYRVESGQAKQVWSDISMNILRGDWVAVVGRNGSGKSTLASVLLELCPLSSGQLLKDREGLTIRGVLQIPDTQFVGDTVEEELQHIPLAEDISAEARKMKYEEVLSRVGLQVPVGRLLASLSGGQKQLVNIAAALAAEPDILVLDEPTAMLDPAARHDVLRAVKEAHQRGTTIVWITHRMEEVAEASRVVAFGEGRIAYDGCPKEFFYGQSSGPACGKSELSQSAGTIHEGILPPYQRLGVEPPFVVQTALLLMDQGWELHPLPLCAEELAEAVKML